MAQRLSCVSISPYRRLSQTNCSLLSRSRERSQLLEEISYRGGASCGRTQAASVLSVHIVVARAHLQFDNQRKMVAKTPPPPRQSGIGRIKGQDFRDTARCEIHRGPFVH